MRPVVLAIVLTGVAATATAAPRAPLAPGERTCVERRQVRTIEPGPGGQLVFRMNGGPDYTNKQRTACDYNPNFQIIINRDYSGGAQYCELDLLELQDRTTGTYGGTCALGSFTALPKTSAHP